MTRRIAGLAIVGAGLIAITAIVGVSLDRRAYFFYRFQDRSRWEYPTGAVVFVVVASIIETAILFGAVVPARPGRVWMRALGGLAVMCPWTLIISQFVVHAPGFWLAHLLWAWLVVVILAMAFLVSGAWHAHHRLAHIGPVIRLME
jgi:hypothetical protein